MAAMIQTPRRHMARFRVRHQASFSRRASSAGTRAFSKSGATSTQLGRTVGPLALTCGFGDSGTNAAMNHAGEKKRG